MPFVEYSEVEPLIIYGQRAALTRDSNELFNRIEAAAARELSDKSGVAIPAEITPTNRPDWIINAMADIINAKLANAQSASFSDELMVSIRQAYASAIALAESKREKAEAGSTIARTGFFRRL